MGVAGAAPHLGLTLEDMSSCPDTLQVGGVVQGCQRSCILDLALNLSSHHQRPGNCLAMHHPVPTGLHLLCWQVSGVW